MWTYLSRSLDGVDADELEGHLQVCQRCCGELELSRELRDRVSAVETERMPGELRGRMEELVRQRMTDPGGDAR